jgi:hypothetical protein
MLELRKLVTVAEETFIEGGKAAEPPVVLAAWPDSVFPPPAELATEVRQALTVTLPLRVPSGEKPCAR